MKFEEAGKALDREVAKLTTYLDKKVKPAARRDMARMLRQASRRLDKLARELDSPAR